MQVGLLDYGEYEDYYSNVRELTLLSFSSFPPFFFSIQELLLHNSSLSFSIFSLSLFWTRQTFQMQAGDMTQADLQLIALVEADVEEDLSEQDIGAVGQIMKKRRPMKQQKKRHNIYYEANWHI